MITDPPPAPTPVIPATLLAPLALTAATETGPSPAAPLLRCRTRNNGSSGGGGGGDDEICTVSNNPLPSSSLQESFQAGISTGNATDGPVTAATAAPATPGVGPQAPAAPSTSSPRPPGPPSTASPTRPSPASSNRGGGGGGGAAAPVAAAASNRASAAPAASPNPPHCSVVAATPAAAPPPGLTVAGQMSLQECCCKVLVRNISVHNCLELLQVVRGFEAPHLESIAAACVRYAVHSFETLQELRSEEQLRQALSDEVYDNLLSALRERVQALAEMRGLLGRVVEPRRPAAGQELGPRQGPSVSGRPVSYPLEALQAGVAWPDGVEAADRETWLAEDDFRRSFSGLGWEEFCRLPAWRKTRLKQEAGLF